MLLSPRFELLHTFTSDGFDLTGPTPIVLGPEPFAELYGTEFNGSSVTGLVVFDGALYAGLTYWMSGPDFGIYWGNHFEGGALAGGRWRITNNADFYWPRTQRAVPDGNMVLLYSPNSTAIYAHSVSGWFQWRAELPDLPRMIGLENGVVHALTGNTVQRLDLTSGALLSEVSMGLTEEVMAVSNNMLYTARGVDFNFVELRKRAMDGTVLWEHTFFIGGDDVFITGLVVDDAEGAWATVSKFDMDEFNMVGGILLGVDASGSPLPQRIFGDAFHSLATDGNMLYMTGWLDNSGTETFLIAVDPALITSTDAVASTSEQDLRCWPLPANDQLQVRVPDGVRSLLLFDAVGREVGRWHVEHDGSNTLLDVAPFANGHYLLCATGTGKVRSTSVVIAR